ncbi:hypothetical protein RJ639_004651 [Escallonia herrerae]|uniref:Reverse transcriptase Ty1/copia-type domain-containing protein n=1 Tax=Escallonia herrerae TaxID=1293975 RepID=A0AA88W1F6_9ASTE|nr:hypothetical protein RJ639_004651 [Escallonia herrerae]
MAVMSFLGALPPEFDTAKSQILSGTDITSLQEAFNGVLRTESTSSNQQSSVLVANRGRESEAGRMNNNRGGKRGGDRGGHNGGTSEIVCYYCKEPRHTKHYCKKLQNRNQRAWTTTAIVAATSSSSPEKTVTISVDDFRSHSAPSPVTIADGSNYTIEGSRTVKPTSSITLSSVLSLPSLAFNLMSDLMTKQTVGKGHVSDGLYILDEWVPHSVACSGVVSPFEAHLDCESCHFAKHHRSSLSPRVNKRIESAFELVHYDVWGPLPIEPAISEDRTREDGLSVPVFVPVEPSNATDGANSSVAQSEDVDCLGEQAIIPSSPVKPPIVQVYPRKQERHDTCPAPAPSSSNPPPNDLDLPIGLHKDSISIPKTVKEALSHPGWHNAMLEEIQALDDNHTWNLVNLPEGKKAVGCKWVYAIKFNADGPVARLKARLVYMEQPPGSVAQGEYGKVCHLKKSSYGLQQSPRAWFAKFTEVAQEFGLQKSKCDHSVFYRKSNAGVILLVVYVDDIVITGDDCTGIASLKKFLQTKYFLEIKVTRSKKGIFLSQRKYVLDLLVETGKAGAKPCNTPMNPSVHLTKDDGDRLDDPEKYRRLVGKLNYVTVTRPNIAYAVSTVSQFMSKPTVKHWAALKQILCYLKGAPGLGLLYSNHGHSCIECFLDANWAGSKLDRKSTTGYCVFVGGNLVS